ncbi:hypothetical protein [Massilia sp. 9096]|uniref:hypothetical protein n=1 Tax=Massilia sp. 9096 TaxID=1500894 RepID=UPI00055F3120|nr:hypothetical protein [Massilia sp. 9096]
MHKRTLFKGAVLAGLAPLANAAQPAQAAARGPGLLTVTGAIEHSNRGPFDPVLDQMMHKQQVSFTKAYVFDAAALAALPAVTIRPTLEYDAKPHTLSGPLLLHVLVRAGARVSDDMTLTLRAVDGYNVELTGKQVRTRQVIVATRIDGGPMPLGGLGPLWAVYDADRVPEMAKLPLPQRFQQCPWALYHVDIKEAG